MESSIAVALLALLCVSIVLTRSSALQAPDEAREAGIAREMADSGDFVVPRLNGSPFLEKPPLQYAVAAVSMRLLGPTLRAVRLPSGLFGVLAVLMVFAIVWRISSSAAGAVLASAALGSSFYFQDTIHHCLTNAPLIAAVSFAMLASERMLAARRWLIWGALFNAALALGFLSKNLFGAAVPAAAIACYAMLARDFRFVRRLILTPAVLAFIALAAPWVWLLYRAGESEIHGRGASFVYEAMITNNFGRFFQGYGGHISYHWYEVGGFLAAALAPWTPLAVVALVDAARKSLGHDSLARRRTLLLTAWMVGPLLLMLASRSRRPDYLVVMIAPYAAAIGVWWADVAQDGSRWLERWIAVAATVVFAAAPLAIPIEHAIAVFEIGGLVSLAAALLAIVLIALAARCALRRSLDELALVAAAGAIAITFAPLDPAIAQARDAAEGGGFEREVAALSPQGQIGALGLGEPEHGAAYFYLGRTVTDLDDRTIEERTALLDNPDTAGILIAERGSDGRVPVASQLIAHYFGPDPPRLTIRLDRMTNQRRLLFITR